MHQYSYREADLASVTADKVLAAEQRAYGAFGACEDALILFPCLLYEAIHCKSERLPAVFERWQKRIAELEAAWSPSPPIEVLRVIELGNADRHTAFSSLEREYGTAHEAAGEFARELLGLFDVVTGPGSFRDPATKHHLEQKLELTSNVSVTAESCRTLLSKESAAAIAWLKKRTPPTTDGPVDGFRWRHNGEVTQGKMQPAAWRMVNYLWRQPGRSATFDALKGPVYSDSEHLADANAFGSLRRAANEFFSEHGLPWRVSVKKAVVSLAAAE